MTQRLRPYMRVFAEFPRGINLMVETRDNRRARWVTHQRIGKAEMHYGHLEYDHAFAKPRFVFGDPEVAKWFKKKYVVKRLTYEDKSYPAIDERIRSYHLASVKAWRRETLARLNKGVV